MSNLTDAIERLMHTATQSRSVRIDCWGLFKAEIVKLREKININSEGPLEILDSSGQKIDEYDRGEILAYARIIDHLSHANTTYGNVKGQEIFKILYNFEYRQIPYMESNTVVLKNELTAPCMKCGILLPAKLLTIDHQRPQTGGSLEAVVKVFRACGLTQAGPKGAKGNMILNHLHLGNPFTAIPTRLNRPVIQDGGRDSRYTLNDKGVILFSLAVAAEYQDILEDKCMHCLMNLSPLCQSCNSSRGNPLKF